MSDPTNPTDPNRAPWVNSYLNQPPVVWAIADAPTAPPVSEIASGRTGHWEWHEDFREDGIVARRYPTWIADPRVPSDVRQRNSARQVVVNLRTANIELDTIITTFRALVSPTAAQQRRFNMDFADAQVKINQLQMRVSLRLLDAGDGLEAETPLLTALRTGAP